jgi:hypothetical protein
LIGIEPRLPSAAPFQIRVRVNSTNVYRCMVDEGSSTSIISSLTWKALGSPKLLTADSQLLAYDRRPGESMGVLPQLPITLGGKTVLIDMMVVDSPLDFNMLLGRDYVYAMNAVVSSLFRVMMYFLITGILSLLISLHLIITTLIRIYCRIPLGLFQVFK